MPGDRNSRSNNRRGTSRPAGGRGSGRGGSRGGGQQRGRGREFQKELTEAERRAAEIRRTRGPKKQPELTEQEKIESRTVEQWIDEGSVDDRGSMRDAAAAASQRGATKPTRSGRRNDPQLDPEVTAAIQEAVGSERGAKLAQRLADAAAALERERFSDAKRIVAPLVKDLPGIATVHEVNGLIEYRKGRWQAAAKALETARSINQDPALLPVLADVYRAQKNWEGVSRIWMQIRELSPTHDVMAEGRIVAASALADQNDFAGAIEMMQQVAQPPKKVRVHHLRQWYVLADLYDRAGEHVTATRWFRTVASHDADFADVKQRLRSLGR